MNLFNFHRAYSNSKCESGCAAFPWLPEGGVATRSGHRSNPEAATASPAAAVSDDGGQRYAVQARNAYKCVSFSILHLHGQTLDC